MMRENIFLECENANLVLQCTWKTSKEKVKDITKRLKTSQKLEVPITIEEKNEKNLY